VLVPNSTTWYVRRSGVARSSFRWLIVALWSFVICHIARIRFCDPRFGLVFCAAPVLFWRPCTPPSASHCHFAGVAIGLFFVVSARIQLRDPLCWLVRCAVCVFVLPPPWVWRRPPHPQQHHTVCNRNGNAVVRVLSLWFDSVRRTVRALFVERSVWLFAIVYMLKLTSLLQRPYSQTLPCSLHRAAPNTTICFLLLLHLTNFHFCCNSL
jgi:hypothetical protein